MTGYAAAKLINAALEAAGVQKAIPPQMVYNYMKKGYIATTADGHVDVASLEAWLGRYLQKQGVTVELDEQAQFDAAEAS
jgi:ABC-type branched-subunit amino acid transport system substrate-binding protein